jgi:hypothetical protein
LRRILFLTAAVLVALPQRLITQTTEAQGATQTGATASDASSQEDWLTHFRAGVQIAVSQFHPYNHRWIASVRLPF